MLNCNMQKSENEIIAEFKEASLPVIEGTKTSYADSVKKTVPASVVVLQPKTKQRCSATHTILDEKKHSETD